MQEKFDDFISSSCEMKSLSNQLIVIGSISKAGEDYLEINSKKEKLPLEQANSKVKIIVNSRKSGRQVLIGTVYLSTEDMIRITDLKTLAEFEKRKYFRVNLQLDSEAVKLINNKLNSTAEEKPVIYPIKIKDASLGGLQFESNMAFENDDEIIVLFPVLNKNLYLAAKICRKSKKDGVAVYGSKFIDPPQSDLDFLYKYLLQQEFNEIQNKRKK